VFALGRREIAHLTFAVNGEQQKMCLFLPSVIDYTRTTAFSFMAMAVANAYLTQPPGVLDYVTAGGAEHEQILQSAERVVSKIVSTMTCKRRKFYKDSIHCCFSRL